MRFVGTSFTLRKIIPDQFHRFMVRARTSAGWGEWSNATRWLRTAPAVPSPPNTPWQVDCNDSIMWMEWNHSKRPGKDSSISNGRDIDAYHLQYRTKHQPIGVWIDCGDDIYPEMKAMVLECAPLVPHFYRVRAHNELGWSDWSVESEGLVTLRRH